jgi:signal transduction histidine kinase
MPDTEKQISIPKVKDGIAGSILHSLPIGVVVFDRKLNVVNANSCAAAFMDIKRSAEGTLAAGTDEKIWGNWRPILLDVVENGRKFRFDNVHYRTSESQASLQLTFVPLKGSDDLIQGGIIMLENVTERENIKKQLAGSEKFAAMGKLASKVAHELNNPIDGIMRYINLAKRAIADKAGPKPVEYLQHATDGLKRMVQIITELLEFSRSRYSTLEDTPLDKILDDAIKFIEPAARTAEVKIEKQYQSSLPQTKRSDIFQVFCNLLKNAVEAMPDGGTITISCDVSEHNTAVIKFRDTGMGFEPENSEAIFEPFFTTKTGSRGTGLGLAISRDIVEKYGGKITAQNAQDIGSIFTVSLPLNE